MNREQQEMALWLRIYERWYSRAVYDAAECGDVADYAVEQFRKRYPAEPTASAPAPVWYDEPPFKKDGGIYYCWVEGSTVPQSIYWSGGGSGAWLHFCDRTPVHPLNGRRVSPITKPQEPTQ